MIFLVAIAAGVFTVTSQRNQLYEQVDAQLAATPLPPEHPPPAAAERGPPADAPDRNEAQPVDNESISDLYVAIVSEDGVLRTRIEGQLLINTPDVVSLVDTPPSETTLSTADGVDDMSTFRVLFLPATETSLGAIVAVPVDDIDDTIRQLTVTFAGAAGLILLALIVD